MAQALLSLGSTIDPVANLRVAAARRKRLRREARMRQANSAPVCKPNEEPAAAPPRRRRRRACRKAPQKPPLRHLRKRMTIENALVTLPVKRRKVAAHRRRPFRRWCEKGG